MNLFPDNDKRHRLSLWVAVCRLIAHSPAYKYNFNVWRSKTRGDGTVLEGWFMLGVNKDNGEQMLYYMPIDWWNQTWFADTLSEAPKTDGCTSDELLDRIDHLII